MHSIISHILIRFLQAAGYTHTDSYAISILSTILTTHLHNLLKSLQKLTTHAQRSKTTLIDLHSLTSLLNLKVSFIELQFEQANYIINTNRMLSGHAFENSIVSKIDRYIHIYEFMPSFPPTHTFKKTFPKETIKHETPEKIKMRLDQVARAEKNLIRILKVSKGLGRRVNFMDRMCGGN